MARLPDVGDAIYAAAEQWKKSCLLADGSVFHAGEIWTRDHAHELIVHFVDKPDEGARNFEEKLEDQLRPASVQAKQLAAEMIWVMMLFPSSLRRERKVELIRLVWSWSGEPLRDPDEMLRVMEQGIGSGGMGYNNYRPFEMFLLIRFTEAWKTLSDDERRGLIGDPWRFADWFDRLPDATSRQFRHMLLHLLFPEHFERISSKTDKKRVDASFGSVLAGERIDPVDRGASAIARDRRLWLIRQKLEAERPHEPIDYYSTPELKARWQPAEDSAVSPATDRNDSASPAVVREAPPRRKRVWALGAGHGGSEWPVFLEEQIVAIGWDELGDLRAYSTQDEIREAIRRLYDRTTDPTNDSLACYQFCHDVAIGDEIFVKQGRSRILGRGVVVGDYEFQSSRASYKHIRRVEWVGRGNWTLPETAQLPLKTLTDISGYSAVVDFLRDRERSAPAPAEAAKPYGIADLLRDAFIERSEAESMVSSLRRRKNVILQGPPGVGKSFIARRLAFALVGAEAPDNVQMVQFHQSYAYEDFIQGWRPTEEGGFSLKPGIFYSFCMRAQARPDEPHVFVVDEINRGNLSKVFGELMLLIEADKRGPDFAIPLTYAESPSDTFYVPDNLYIIGLMNTADRSLAMVDYALRRRFAFRTLEPAFDSPAFAALLAKQGVSRGTIARIRSRIGEVNGKIRADEKNLGPGFAIGHSYFCPTEAVEDDSTWYSAVVRDELIPLLEEYWFDDPKRVAECAQILTS